MSATGKSLPVLNVAADQAPLCRFACFAIIVAASAVIAGHIANAFPLLSANDRSRWCTVWSLVERGTYAIEETQTEEFKKQTIAVEPEPPPLVALGDN